MVDTVVMEIVFVVGVVEGLSGATNLTMGYRPEDPF
jgi:hypothetical protein